MLLLLSRFSRVQLCATPQTAAHQAPPSLGFSRQEHWSGLPFPSPIDKIDLNIKKITRDKDGHYIMIKGSIQEKHITIVNIYAPKVGAPQFTYI